MKVDMPLNQEAKSNQSLKMKKQKQKELYMGTIQ